MTNSPLINHVNRSANKTSPRNHEIDTITIHCFVGQFSVERMCEMLKPSKKNASANYVIGTDGRIGLCVDEVDRSWCSSNRANDHRAITIECASDLTAPYSINDAVMQSLIILLVDICKRNNIPELRWKAKKSLVGQVDKQNVTVHRWFASKSCPGDYIYSHLSDICDAVNLRLQLPVKVKTDSVQIYTGPNIQWAYPDKTTGAGVFTITELAFGDEDVQLWGKLKSDAGWISLDHATFL